MDSIKELVASVLGIRPKRVTDDLAFESIPEWDSLNHVKLMLAIEQTYGKEVDEEQMVEMTTVAAIRAFVAV